MARRIISKKETPQNERLAARAQLAVRDPLFSTRPRLCQQFVRMVIQSEYGGKYDAYHKGTAEASRRAWSKSAYAVNPARGSVVGDILYKRGDAREPAGHVGIRVPGNRVAENSSTPLGRVSGAKGFRTLEDFGNVDLIVRLPDGK